MTIIHLEIDIPMSADEFFDLMYTDTWDVFQGAYIGLKSVEQLEFKQEITVPQAFLWYLGQTEFHYHDRQVKDYKNKVVNFRIRPPVYEDYLDISGTVKVEPINESRCKQIMDVNVVIYVWGVGSMIESLLAQDMEAKARLVPDAVKVWQERNGKTVNETSVTTEKVVLTKAQAAN